jgi:hypothetical protein
MIVMTKNVWLLNDLRKNLDERKLRAKQENHCKKATLSTAELSR